MRKRYGTSQLSNLIDRITRPVLKERGVVESRIYLDWEKIVGTTLAGVTEPERLTFPKDKKSGGVLHVHVEGSFALALQHEIPNVLDKISTYFGYKAVERITIHQRPISKKKPKKETIPDISGVPVGEDVLALIGQIDDPELREKLSSVAKYRQVKPPSS